MKDVAALSIDYIPVEKAMVATLSFFHESYLEVEEAVDWTLAMLRGDRLHRRAKPNPEAVCLSERCSLIQQFLLRRPLLHEFNRLLVEQTLEECLELHAFRTRLSAHYDHRNRSDRPSSIEADCQATIRMRSIQALGLAMKILGLQLLTDHD